MQVDYLIRLDLNKDHEQALLEIRQGDTNTRVLRFFLHAGGKAYDISDKHAVLHFSKPDGTAGTVRCTHSAEKGVCCCIVSSQMSAVAGEVRCDLKLYSGDTLLHSPKFYLLVGTDALSGDTSADTFGDEKADKVENAVSGHLAALDAEGNLVDSGVFPSGETTDWSEVQNKPFSEIGAGLSVADDKLTADAPEWDAVQHKPATFAPSTHSHPQSDVTGLAAALEGKAAASHSHPQSDVTGLTAALAGKAAVSHSHPQSDITGLATVLTDIENDIDIIADYCDELDTGKVDKVSGKGLSTNDYTTAEKNKLAGIEAGAEVNEIDTIEAGANVTVTKSGKTVTISASGGGGAAVVKEAAYVGSYAGLADYPASEHQNEYAYTYINADGNTTIYQSRVSSTGWEWSLIGYLTGDAVQVIRWGKRLFVPKRISSSVTAVEEVDYASVESVAAKYTKPGTGIPKADLSNGVQSSLDKADSALQEHQSLAAYRTSSEQDVIDNNQNTEINEIKSIVDLQKDEITTGNLISSWIDGKYAQSPNYFVDYSLMSIGTADISGYDYIIVTPYVNPGDVNFPMILYSEDGSRYISGGFTDYELLKDGVYRIKVPAGTPELTRIRLNILTSKKSSSFVKGVYSDRQVGNPNKYPDSLNPPFSFANKTAVVFGDSISAGVSSPNFELVDSFISIFSSQVGLSIVNDSVSGGCLSGVDGTSVVSHVNSFHTQKDFIFVCAGTNDFNTGKPLGNYGDSTAETFYGAMKVICDRFKTDFQSSTIIFISPIPYTKTSRFHNVLNSVGCNLNDYRNAIYEVATAYGFNVVNGGSIGMPDGAGGWSNYIIADSDGCHPTEEGHKLYAKNLAGKLLYVDAEKEAKTATVTIAVADWAGGTTCVKSVTGVTAASVVIVDTSDGGVECTAQGAGTLTFTAAATPTAPVTAKVVIL